MLDTSQVSGGNLPSLRRSKAEEDRPMEIYGDEVCRQ